MADLGTFFSPKTIALFGARPEEGHVGHALMKNLLAGGGRRVIPVTDLYEHVLDVPAVRTILDAADPIDLAVIAVAPTKVAETIRACGEKGIHHAVVITAGFKEVGEEGRRMEQEVANAACESGVLLVGPNCLGVLDAHASLNATFSAHAPLPGHIGFISQSGAIGTSFIEWSRGEGVGVSKFASMGNEAGVSEIAMLEFFGRDPETKAILMYLEHVSDGKKFLQIAKEIVEERKKPIVILRAGRSAGGARAVASHTGSLAPEDAIFTAACRQAGIATVTSLRDLFNAAKLLALRTDWSEKTRLAVVTNGGGPSVNAADLIELSESMELVAFDEATRAALHAVLPPMAALGDPVDVIGDAGAGRYRSALDIVTALPGVDAIMVIVTPQMMTDHAGIAEVLQEESAKKPIIPVMMGGDVARPGVAVLAKHGMVNFDLPSDAVFALDAVTPLRKAPAREHPRAHASAAMRSWDDTTALLTRYGLPPIGVLARTKDDVVRVWGEVGAVTVAMKAISRGVIHKTDIGAVRLNISSPEMILSAWDEITAAINEKAPHATIDGFLIQPMLKGKEVLVGMKRDATFGPVVVFGLGGIFVEILRDTTMRVAPFTESDAKEMLSEIAGARYLDGFRGAKPANKDALARLLVAVGNLALENPDVIEIDLNPVVVTEDAALIADARILAQG